MSVKDSLDSMGEPAPEAVSEHEEFIDEAPKSNRNRIVILAALAVSVIAGVTTMFMHKSAPADPASVEKTADLGEPKPIVQPQAAVAGDPAAATVPAPAIGTAPSGVETGSSLPGSSAPANAMPQTALGGPEATTPPIAQPAPTSAMAAAAPAVSATPSTPPPPVTAAVAPKAQTQRSSATTSPKDAATKPAADAVHAVPKGGAQSRKLSIEKSEPVADAVPAPKHRTSGKYSATPTVVANPIMALEPVSAEPILVVR